MTLSDKQMEKILSQDIEISDVVNDRINETYGMLRADAKNQKKHVRHRKHSAAAAAIAVICCLAIPGGVYAAANSDFFEGMFGNSTKKSTPAVTKEVDNQKGGTVSVTLPSHEFVSLDPERAAELLGEGAMDAPIEKKIGDHIMRIENLVYDKNSAFVYYTLERKGGVTLLEGNEETNMAKGAFIPEDSLYQFSFETTSGGTCGSNIYIDTEKSTKDKLYCCEYMIWIEEDGLAEGEFPVLSITELPCPAAELEEEDYDKIKTETTVLTEKEPLKTQKIDMGKEGYLEYSPVSLSVDMTKGTGLSEEDAGDAICLKHMEIKYKDGTSYIITDLDENIENNSYVLGTGMMYKTTFNRVVDTSEIKEIIVNDKSFPAK